MGSNPVGVTKKEDRQKPVFFYVQWDSNGWEVAKQPNSRRNGCLPPRRDSKAKPCGANPLGSPKRKTGKSLSFLKGERWNTHLRSTIKQF